MDRRQNRTDDLRQQTGHRLRISGILDDRVSSAHLDPSLEGNCAEEKKRRAADAARRSFIKRLPEGLPRGFLLPQHANAQKGEERSQSRLRELPRPLTSGCDLRRSSRAYPSASPTSAATDCDSG